MKASKDENGMLNWMITWQSLHGGIVIEYRETQRKAEELTDHLKRLGRIPLIWQRWE